MYYVDSRVEGKTGNKGKILKGRYDILYTTAFPLILCSLKERDAFLQTSGDPQSLWKEKEYVHT